MIVKAKITLNAGLMRAGGDDVDCGWMPGDRHIGVMEKAIARQIGFAAAAFFRRTANDLDRPRQAPSLKNIPDQQGGADGAGC